MTICKQVLLLKSLPLPIGGGDIKINRTDCKSLAPLDTILCDTGARLYVEAAAGRSPTGFCGSGDILPPLLNAILKFCKKPHSAAEISEIDGLRLLKIPRRQGLRSGPRYGVRSINI